MCRSDLAEDEVRGVRQLAIRVLDAAEHSLEAAEGRGNQLPAPHEPQGDGHETLSPHLIDRRRLGAQSPQLLSGGDGEGEGAHRARDVARTVVAESGKKTQHRLGAKALLRKLSEQCRVAADGRCDRDEVAACEPGSTRPVFRVDRRAEREGDIALVPPVRQSRMQLKQFDSRNAAQKCFAQQRLQAESSDRAFGFPCPETAGLDVIEHACARGVRSEGGGLLGGEGLEYCRRQ